MTWLPRTLGVLTVAYGLATIVRPAILSRPAGLSGDKPSSAVGVLVRAVGVRDVAIGAGMVAAPAGPVLRAAVAARIASDLGDAVTFGLSTGIPADGRRKAVLVAVGWGALNALALAAVRNT